MMDRERLAHLAKMLAKEALSHGDQLDAFRARMAELEAERDAALNRAREARETAENYLGHCDAACKQLEVVEAERDNAVRYTELLIQERDNAKSEELEVLRLRIAEVEGERDAAKAEAARAVDMVRKCHQWASKSADLTTCNAPWDLTVYRNTGSFLESAGPVLNWLAQREREAVVAELREWAERWWESHSDFSAGDFEQRIAALTNQQPTACPRSEVRGEENSNA